VYVNLFCSLISIMLLLILFDIEDN
jgi:hypothetical protein